MESRSSVNLHSDNEGNNSDYASNVKINSKSKLSKSRVYHRTDSGIDINSKRLHANNRFFRDSQDRAIILRGVNLSGSSKNPPGQPSDNPDLFTMTVGRFDQPIPDGEEGDRHLHRIRGWGFNTIRYVIVWEALEHEGPGIYDTEYISKTIRTLVRLKNFGFYVYMDPHQDLWSRFSGGSGAPLWTLHACGMEPRAFRDTQAALLHSEWDDGPANMPSMLWSTNYKRLASLTLFTLFFGGKHYAPKCIIDGVNIQEYLQSHYINAFRQVAMAIHAEPGLEDECVIGWDSMNEPAEGFIGTHNLDEIPAEQSLKKGTTPTPFQGIILGVGKSVIVQNHTFGAFGPVKDLDMIVDPGGTSIWSFAHDRRWGFQRGSEWKPNTCIWQLHGVWEDGNVPTLLKPDYFAHSPDNFPAKANFVKEFWKPHFDIWACAIREIHKDAILFAQPPVFAAPPVIDEDILQDRACLSTHYYDGLTLMTKHWNPWLNADALGVMRGNYSSVVLAAKFGSVAIRKSFREQLGILRNDALILGDYPTMIGEIGIPYDMDGKRAYGMNGKGIGKGDYTSQQLALDASLNACDGLNCLNYTIWTYLADHSYKWGDFWNGEDLSLWSPEDAKSGLQEPSTNEALSQPLSRNSSRTAVDSQSSDWESHSHKQSLKNLLTCGARAAPAFSRPYPIATVGTPHRIEFDIKSSIFKYHVEVGARDKSTPTNATEIFIPFIHYSSNKYCGECATDQAEPLESSNNLLDINVKITKGKYEIEGQILRWYYDPPEKGFINSVASFQTETMPPAPESPMYSITISRRNGAHPHNVAHGSTVLDWICPGSAIVDGPEDEKSNCVVS